MPQDVENDIVIIDQLPSNSWFEGCVLRPNGFALATRLDAPELYTFPPHEPGATPTLVHDFSEHATGLINLCALPGRPDEYVVISGTVDMAKIHFDNFFLWHVAMDGSAPTKLADLGQTEFSIGVTAVTDRLLLVADSAKACIWRLDLDTQALEVLKGDETMKTASKDDFFGLNRLRVAGGYCWYTNSSVGTLCRFPVSAAPDLRATGPIEVVARHMPHCDGLALTPDLATAYLVSYTQGHVWRVDTATGEATVVKENLISPTSVEYDEGGGKPRLYTLCCGEFDMGWVNDETRSWSDLAHINSSVSVTVTTTTEEVVESA